ncbi:MAG TPA: hypothetical protein VMR88_09670 [Candidatus Polarisedimenticolaceae bacterium]|nr:hypothetical protein [Candidatus Polarisedimenticolaceae bacterium]
MAKTADAKLPIIKITRVLPFVCAVHLFGVLAWLNLNTSDDQHTSRLAESFLQWKLVLLPSVPMSWGDTALFQGHHYSPFGPFPAILSMPLVWAGYFHQGALSFVASLAVFYLCFRLAENFNYSRNEAGWFALAFCFATSFIGVAALACSAFFAHVIAVMLLFLAINEYEGRKRLWLIGGFIGLATATRLPNGLNILFFMLAVSLGAGTIQERAAELLKLLLPFAVFVGLLALYNFARFGTPLESGYTYQLNGFGMPYASWNVPGNTAGSALSFSYIPEHLWIFLFGPPSISAVGTSVLLVSPFLFYLISVRWDLINKLIALNSALVLLTVLAFRSTGFEQVGYRFSLDFLPFVFWLLMRSRLQMNNRFKALICLALVVDVCLTAFYLSTGVNRRQGDSSSYEALME